VKLEDNGGRWLYRSITIEYMNLELLISTGEMLQDLGDVLSGREYETLTSQSCTNPIMSIQWGRISSLSEISTFEFIRIYR